MSFKNWINAFLDWLKSLFFRQEMEVTVVGLNGSGKTTLVKVISNDAIPQDMIPTVGFNMQKAQRGKVTIKFWDLGGQPRFRTLWERYCHGVNAIVFVVDAADEGRLETAKNELHNLLDKPQLYQIPVLVLGNKNDLSGCLSSQQLVERLDLVPLGQHREVSCYSISAKYLTNIDITIQWLIRHSGSHGSDRRMTGHHSQIVTEQAM